MTNMKQIIDYKFMNKKDCIAKKDDILLVKTELKKQKSESIK